MATYIRKLSKGTRWFYKFDLDGKTFRSKAIYDSKQEAKQAEAQEYQQARATQKRITQAVTVQMAIAERIDFVKSRSSIKYFRDTKRYLTIFRNHFYSRSIDEISRAEIEDILTVESRRGVYMANAMLRVFKAFYNHLIDRYELPFRNPCLKIKPFPIEKRIKYIPTDEEIEILLQSCNDSQRKLIEFIRDTGSRLSEALNLKGRDVTNVDVVLYTRKAHYSNLTARIVPKPHCLIGQTFLPDTKIFGYWKEQPKFLERKLKSLGLPSWGYHNLRHRYASLLSSAHTPLYEIMILLGHQNLTTTQRYLQLLPRRNGDENNGIYSPRGNIETIEKVEK